MADFNENLTRIIDDFEPDYQSCVSNNDLVPEARRRGARAVIEQAEDAIADDDRAFERAVEEERTRLTGQLEAAQEQHAKPRNDVGAMMMANAAVSSGDPATINSAFEDALRRGDESALSILEAAGPAAMPEGLRDGFKEKVAEAREARKPAVVKERETALAAFEADAERKAYSRSMIRGAFVTKLRAYKGPGA